MKVIRISDVIHEHLKQEAKREGRTLQWVVEERLAQPKSSMNTINMRGNDSVVWETGTPPVVSEGKGSTELTIPVTLPNKSKMSVFPRTPQQVAKEAYALKNQLEAERKGNAENQDPDYWDDFNERYKQIDELWKEYHQLRGE